MDLNFILLTLTWLHHRKKHQSNKTYNITKALPNCPYTYYVKSIYTYQKDDIESAIRYTQQAIKLQSKEGQFYIMLGDLLYKQFNLELATTYWKKATEGMDLAHLEQQRFRIKHMNKINTEYWISPEFLSFR